MKKAVIYHPPLDPHLTHNKKETTQVRNLHDRIASFALQMLRTYSVDTL